MTRSVDLTLLREALEKTGSGWLLEYWGAEVDQQLQKLSAALEAFSREYHRRFKERPDLFGLLEANSAKAAAFFQVDSLLASREMKIMIWRILLGCEIKQVEFHYAAEQATSLRVTLNTPYGEEEAYVSNDTSDYRVLRHFGLTGVTGNSVLQGYYALRGGR